MINNVNEDARMHETLANERTSGRRSVGSSSGRPMTQSEIEERYGAYDRAIAKLLAEARATGKK